MNQPRRKASRFIVKLGDGDGKTGAPLEGNTACSSNEPAKIKKDFLQKGNLKSELPESTRA
eukprot:4717066-Heterocapsa_arctica.AAC.1